MDLFKPRWKEPVSLYLLYSVVVDIDDLLVASTWDIRICSRGYADRQLIDEKQRQHGWRTSKRAGVDYYLAYMSQYDEIVVFTTQYVYSAQPVLESLVLTPFIAVIQYRLFRESARMHNSELVKGLAYLNRDLSINDDEIAQIMRPDGGA
ncbi:hypothetical protein CALVIDRAFT_530243 [Calocera viscosa TUFC12733]|uniref:Mitochondrial import inner membrane translocase subunit TIM50 n=1 Tax=Calocera viscosa (strain TUFC12733) TaxID=1330018 RepID=A0A167I3G2_CALVF|nr:hypothetical protein CALVIDRAFT_530243 [Calocera viscosa TUFC12733]